MLVLFSSKNVSCSDSPFKCNAKEATDVIQSVRLSHDRYLKSGTTTVHQWSCVTFISRRRPRLVADTVFRQRVSRSWFSLTLLNTPARTCNASFYFFDLHSGQVALCLSDWDTRKDIMDVNNHCYQRRSTFCERCLVMSGKDLLSSLAIKQCRVLLSIKAQHNILYIFYIINEHIVVVFFFF